VTEIVSLADVRRRTVDAALRGGVTSIGNFDGVHRGHAQLLHQTRQLAEELGGPSIACLFDPHPIALLRPHAAPKRLTTVQERADRMRPIGIDFLLVCQTTHALLELSAETFFDALIVDNLACRGMVEGENFYFGKDRRGDVTMLRQLCARHDITFRIAEMESAGGTMISSTRIRDALDRGDVSEAAQMMGHPHRITGRVVRGDGRGRTIGFPTANVRQIEVVIPAAGVYAAIARIQNEQLQDEHRMAAVHVGQSPTFDSGQADQIEVHLIDFKGDLYGETLSVDLIRRVRGVVRFDSPDALATQLTRDILAVRDQLEQHQSK